MLQRAIVIRDSGGLWNAAFEDAPLASFIADRPSLALLVLVQAHPERGIGLNTVVTMHSECTVDKMVFAFGSHDVIENRDDLRAAFLPTIHLSTKRRIFDST